MRELRKAQTIINKLDAQYRNVSGSVKWTELYSSEEEILEDLRKVHVPTDREWNSLPHLYIGYGYIHSFARQLQSGKTELSEKQMRQCKRIALEIKKASAIADCY